MVNSGNRDLVFNSWYLEVMLFVLECSTLTETVGNTKSFSSLEQYRNKLWHYCDTCGAGWTRHMMDMISPMLTAFNPLTAFLVLSEASKTFYNIWFRILSSARHWSHMMWMSQVFKSIKSRTVFSLYGWNMSSNVNNQAYVEIFGHFPSSVEENWKLCWSEQCVCLILIVPANWWAAQSNNLL